MQRTLSLLVLLAASFATYEAAAQPPTPAEPSAPPPVEALRAYSLVVDSDAPEVVSYSAIAAELAAELHDAVAPPSSIRVRAAVVIQYRAQTRTLTVRATHPGGRVLERSIQAEGDAAAVAVEAVLLAGNLGRDEARELLDELDARAPKAAAADAPTPVAPPVPVKKDEDVAPIALSVFYPLATNAGHPDVTTPLSAGLFYDRVGRASALQLTSFGAAHASRSVRGAQIGTGAAISGGSVDGAQVTAGAAYATGRVAGAQVAGIFSFAGVASGAQVAGGVNIANQLDGLQLSVVNVGREVNGVQLGIVNIGRHVKGLQLGVLNIAEEVDGAALGLASLSKDSFHPIVFGTNLAYANVGIKFTTKYAYSSVAMGSGTLENGFDRPLVATVALGAHVPILGGLDADAELAYSHADNGTDTNQSLHPRGIVGYTFAKHFRIFAGGGPRVALAFEKGSPRPRPEAIVGIQF